LTYYSLLGLLIARILTVIESFYKLIDFFLNKSYNSILTKATQEGRTMASNTYDYSSLPYATDFTQLNITDSKLKIDDPKLNDVTGTGVQYQDATANNPTGSWIIQGKTATAGVIMAAMFYNAYLSSDTDAQTQLAALSVNASLANASSSFSKAVREASSTKTSFSHTDLLTLASPYLDKLNMTAEQFIAQVLPKEATTETYTSAEFLALTSTIDQFSNAKLSDNSVLQQKLNVISSNRTMCLDGLSNVLKAWTNMLQSVGRNV
jgi:hypothetical protein